MKLFLIDYDRKVGRVVALRTFDERDRKAASEARLDLELELHRQGVDREVVLLEAADEQAIRTTHRRYFAGVAELAELPRSPGTSQN